MNRKIKNLRLKAFTKPCTSRSEISNSKDCARFGDDLQRAKHDWPLLAVAACSLIPPFAGWFLRASPAEGFHPPG